MTSADRSQRTHIMPENRAISQVIEFLRKLLRHAVLIQPAKQPTTDLINSDKKMKLSKMILKSTVNIDTI